MREYNDTGRALLFALLAASFLGGCATSGDHEPAAADNTPADQTAPATEQGTVQIERQETGNRNQTPPVRDDAPLRYEVKKGDTLWDIAAHFLDDPWYWPELWYANPGIDNPHLIYPGDTLELVWVDGQPRLQRAVARERLSPQARELPIDAAVPTIPLDAIRQFLNGPRLVTRTQLDEAPYIVAFIDEHMVGGTGTEIYVRHLEADNRRRFAVVRAGGPYEDPETGEVLGYEAIPIGSAEILEFAEISTGTLTRTQREALTGDRLLPQEDADALASDFHPHAPETPVDGHIISVFDGVGEIGQYEIVALNRGAEHDLERGHVLDIYQVGRQTRDPVSGERVVLPPLEAGTLMVFKVEQRLSFGLIMTATRAAHVGDSVRAAGGG